jgi:hypothetical protein
MKSQKKSHHVRRYTIYCAAACACGLGSQLCQAQSFPTAREPLHALQTAAPPADLESAFWTCDYVATLRGVEFTPIEQCASAYTRLKDYKFGGDFGAMLDWWRANKVNEHLRIESRRR